MHGEKTSPANKKAPAKILQVDLCAVSQTIQREQNTRHSAHILDGSLPPNAPFEPVKTYAFPMDATRLLRLSSSVASGHNFAVLHFRGQSARITVCFWKSREKKFERDILADRFLSHSCFQSELHVILHGKPPRNVFQNYSCLQTCDAFFGWIIWASFNLQSC